MSDDSLSTAVEDPLNFGAEGSLNIAVIVLAAGSASRFGSAKQLAFFKSEKLISIALNVARKASKNVILVTGAYAEDIESELQSKEYSGIQTLRNPEWKTGMASSIKIAIDSLSSDVQGAIILLADQPLVTETHLQALVKCWNEGGLLQRPWAVATGYKTSPGVPALFDRQAFLALSKLKGDQGARVMLKAKIEGQVNDDQNQPVAIVEPDFSLVDIDTPGQLIELKLG